MDLNVLLYGVGAMGFFTSRAFLPAFVTALMLRYGDNLPFISSFGIFSSTGSEPTWFTSDLSLLVLGVLSVCEVAGDKIPEVQEMLDSVHRYSKTALATLAVLGVVSTQDANFIGSHMQQQAGLFGVIVSAGVAVTVFGLAGVRQRIGQFLAEADPDDDLHLRSILSLFEDIWAAWGIVMLLLYPFLMAGLVVLAVGIMVAIERRISRSSDAVRYGCPDCGHEVRALALDCPSCHHPLRGARRIGAIGQVTSEPVTDREDAALALAERQRCPSCACRLESGRIRQVCGECGHVLFGDPGFVAAYSRRISLRLPWVLVMGSLLSAVPVLGLIPGIILYRWTLVAGYRRYLHGVQAFFLRWVLRLVFLALIVLQIFPGAGALAVPAMALLSYLVYRGCWWSRVNSAR